ncbi:hypothetical protein ABIA51_003751 [Erwinia aphidicola]
MVTDKLILIRVKSTGNEYAYPVSRYSELPTVRVDGGNPGHTNFSRNELIFMEETGSAIRVGYAKMALDINYE